jgi:hypothetical protein
VPVAPHGLEPSWVNPAPLSFTKPSATTCGDLPTLAFTGGMASTGLFTLAGGLIFAGIAGAFVARRRFLTDDKS